MTFERWQWCHEIGLDSFQTNTIIATIKRTVQPEVALEDLAFCQGSGV